MDELYEAVRPHFSGTLVAIVYDRYPVIGEYWQALDHSAWDEVQFQLFGEGNVEGLARYPDEQLAGYMNMVQRDGITHYSLAFSYVYRESPLQPGETFEQIEADLYRTFFEKVAALPRATRHRRGVWTYRPRTESPLGVTIRVRSSRPRSIRRCPHRR